MFHSRKCPKIAIAIWPPSYMASMAVIAMTSSNENIFRVTIAHCQGNPPVTGGFPSQRPAIGAKAGTRGRWHPFTWKYVWKGQSPRQHNGTWSTSPEMMQSLYHVKKIREKIISHSLQLRSVDEIAIYLARDGLLRPELSTTWWKRLVIITSAFTVPTCNLIPLTLSSLETSNYFSSLKPFGRSFVPAYDDEIAWALVSDGLTQLMSLCCVSSIS